MLSLKIGKLTHQQIQEVTACLGLYHDRPDHARPLVVLVTLTLQLFGNDGFEAAGKRDRFLPNQENRGWP